MTTKQPGDRAKTYDIVKNRNQVPIRDGKSWLRHSGQAAEIDKMIWEEKYSIKEMAEALNDESKGFGWLSISKRIKRIRNHMDHLQTGDSKGNWHGQEPHLLKLREIRGKWRFDLD